MDTHQWLSYVIGIMYQKANNVVTDVDCHGQGEREGARDTD